MYWDRGLEENVASSVNDSIPALEHPMGPWWIDLMLSTIGAAVMGLAIARLVVGHYMRGIRTD
jgi:hypothetical protein